MTFNRKVIIVGHSLGITIPVSILRAWNLKHGDEITLKIIKKVKEVEDEKT